MTINSLIYKINTAHGIGEMFGSDDWKKGYRDALIQLRSDKTEKPATVAALLRLNRMRTAYERGHLLRDDAGEMHTYNNGVTFEGRRLLLDQSLQGYNCLRSLSGPAAQHFRAYLPAEMQMKTALKASWQGAAFSLTGRRFPQRHVQWILARLLEYALWLSHEGYVHAGLHPASIWIVPKTYGIIIGSFYHLERRGTRLKTIAEKYQSWYPLDIFVHKTASSKIDIEMIKRTAIYLLGDPSGIGLKLKKDISPGLLDFLLTDHDDVFQCCLAYQRLLKQKLYPFKK